MLTGVEAARSSPGRALRMSIRQLLVDAHGCEGPLDDADALAALLRDAAREVGAHEHGALVSRFVPHGVTAVLVLAESHLLVATWPEHRLALVDVLLCNDTMEPERAWAVIRAGLRPAAVEARAVVRELG